jgi:glutathione S-transferase
MAEKKLVIHGSTLSTCTNALRSFLRANKIAYDFKEVNIFTGENKTEEYTKLNPFQKVPVLVDDGFTLRESMVICRYIANSRQVPDNWYPKDAKKRALVDLGLEYWSQNSGKFFAVAYQQFGKSELTKEKAKEATDTAIKEFETVILKDKKFVAGDSLSLADLPFLFYLWGQNLFTGYNNDEHKRLSQWIQDCFAAEPALKDQATDYANAAQAAFSKK